MVPEASIQGVALGSTTPSQWVGFIVLYSKNSRVVKTSNLFRTVQTEMGAAIVAGIEAGWVNPVINKEYNMDQAAQVHHDIIHSKGAKGKLVLKVAEDM